jgi:hypothetical protein
MVERKASAVRPDQLDNLEFMAFPAASGGSICRGTSFLLRFGERLCVTPEDLGLAAAKLGNDPPIMGECHRGRADRLHIAARQGGGQIIFLGHGRCPINDMPDALGQNFVDWPAGTLLSHWPV